MIFLSTNGIRMFILSQSIYQAVDIWAIAVVLHQFLHGGKTPHQHLLNKGRMRLLFGIFDQRMIKIDDDVEWIAASLPNASGALLRDFFRATQAACLSHEPKERPSASILASHLEENLRRYALQGFAALFQ